MLAAAGGDSGAGDGGAGATSGEAGGAGAEGVSSGLDAGSATGRGSRRSTERGRSARGAIRFGWDAIRAGPLEVILRAECVVAAGFGFVAGA